MNPGILASGNGSNLQSIIDANKKGKLKSSVTVVISNNSKSGVLGRAQSEGIPRCHLMSVLWS